MIERDIFQRIFLDFIVLGIFIDFFPYSIQTLPVQGPLWLWSYGSWIYNNLCN